MIIAILARLCILFLSVEKALLPPTPTYPYRACEEEQEEEAKAEEPKVEGQRLAAEEMREVLDVLEGAEGAQGEQSVPVATSRQTATAQQPQVVSVEPELAREESVLTLQRTFRTVLAQRVFGEEVEKEKEERKRVAAAVKIQARVRGFLARVLYEDMLYARAEEEQVHSSASRCPLS